MVSPWITTDERSTGKFKCQRCYVREKGSRDPIQSSFIPDVLVYQRHLMAVVDEDHCVGRCQLFVALVNFSHTFKTLTESYCA